MSQHHRPLRTSLNGDAKVNGTPGEKTTAGRPTVDLDNRKIDANRTRAMRETRVPHNVAYANGEKGKILVRD